MFQSKCPQLILQRKHFPCGCNLPTTRQAKRSAPALLSSIIKILNLPLLLGFCLHPSKPRALRCLWAALCSLQTPTAFFHFWMTTSHRAPCCCFLLLSGLGSLGILGRQPHHLILQERPRRTITSIMSSFLESRPPNFNQ